MSNSHSDKNQGWHYDTSPYPAMAKGEDNRYHLIEPEYHELTMTSKGDSITPAQYMDVILTAITGVPIDRINVKISTEQLDALVRKHGDQIAQFFTKQ